LDPLLQRCGDPFRRELDGVGKRAALKAMKSLEGLVDREAKDLSDTAAAAAAARGYCAYLGLVGEPDMNDAAAWWKLAAERGRHPAAMMHFGQVCCVCFVWYICFPLK
jgi:TPR repeat protein